jgi:hypothetical protein
LAQQPAATVSAARVQPDCGEIMADPLCEGTTLADRERAGGHAACLGHGGGHRTWTYRACDAFVYGPLLQRRALRVYEKRSSLVHDDYLPADEPPELENEARELLEKVFVCAIEEEANAAAW